MVNQEKTGKTTPQNIDEYVASFPKDIKEILEKIRVTITNTTPEAKEKIAYQMPTFTLEGNLVHFAAFKKHIGFHLIPTGTEAFNKELSAYKRGKGSIQFPLNHPIPLSLITKIVKFRVKENLERALQKRKGKI